MKIKTGVGAAFLLALSLTSCTTPKDIGYFQDATEVIKVAETQPIRVKEGDKLSIIVKTKDAELSDLFNLAIYSSKVGSSSKLNGTASQSREYGSKGGDGVSAYTVDPQGCIDFPILGKLKIAGMTRSEISGFIKGELMGRDLAQNPTVTVEFLSAGVSVLGDVRVPGRYDLNVDNLNVLQVIALAGDLNITGQRKNIKVLRELNGETHIYTIDITDLEKAMKSPGYNIQQNDIVYVEPNDKRKRDSTVNGNSVYNTGFWISVASLITTAVTTIGVFVK